MLDGLGWEQLEDPPRTWRPRWRRWPAGPITSVVPSTTATALTSIATGPHAGRARRRRLPGRGRRRGAQHPALDHAAGRRPPPHRPDAVPAARRLLRAAARRSSPRPSSCARGSAGAHLSDVRFHGYRVPSTLVTELRRQLRAGEPFVYAYYDGIDKVAHEYGLGELLRRRARGGRPAGGRRALGAAAATPRWWSPPTTARSTWATTWSTLHPEVAGPRVVPVGRGPVPLAARPARAGRRAARRGGGATTPTSPGSAPATRPSTRAGGGPTVTDAGPAAGSATSRWSPATRCRSSTRPTPARSS